MREAGNYHFTSRVVQATHPAPTVANVGRGSRTETAYLDGETDLAAQSLLMRVWQGAGNVSNPADAAQVRVEGENAYGRIGNGEWQSIGNFTGSFAPGNDLSSYLVAAKNVVLVASDQNAHFSFDIDGPVLAEHMRTQLKDHLREEGKLPAGLLLNAPEQFRVTAGMGVRGRSIWTQPRPGITSYGSTWSTW